MVNKVVVMAAGKGVRMLPLTKTIPKPLIKINEETFLYYLLNNLQNAGYTKFGIIVGHLSNLVENFVSRHDFDVTLIKQKERLGTGHALKMAKHFVGKDNFITIGGDNLWSANDLKKMNVDDDFCYLAALKHDNPQKYGVLVTNNNLLKKIVEKPKRYIGNLINTGLYKFTPEIFDALDKIKKSERGEFELTDAISLLAKKKKVKVVKLSDYWLDLGSIPDIKRINEFIKSRGL